MNYKNELITIIRKHVPVGKIYLFGSRARGTNSPASDFDIAIDVGAPIDSAALGLIKEAMEDSNIPFFVDVLDFQLVDPVMQHEILKEGIVWST